MNIFIILLIILAVLTALTFAAGYYMFRFSILRIEPKPPVFKNPNDPWAIIEPVLAKGREYIESKPFEEWKIKSDDGLKLWARFMPAYKENGEVSKKVVLMMHGYHSFNNNDFAVSSRYVHEAGYSILLPNQRAHNKSEGKYICFGIKERYDCLKWIQKIISELGDDCEIILMGVSMGCATVTMTLGLDLPPQVKGCVSDCGYTSPREQFAHNLKHDYHLPTFPLLYTQKFYCKHIAGFDIDGCNTVDVLKKNRLPVLFIHGGSDSFVPTDFSRRNYEACAGKKELLIIDEAPHAQSFPLAPEKCWEHLSKFLHDNFSE
ncbi:MAG: alpha/beta hydrolase [Clostridia bacterium]|nr:alpha/beta hydrolase [Clostridia bacterium]